jgi:excisionase family DNA binding protein
METMGRPIRDVPADVRKVFSLREAEAILGIGETSLRNLIRDGKIHAVNVGRRVLVPRTAIDTFLATPSI